MITANYPLLPSGVKDHLPEAGVRLRAAQQALRSEFERWGYRTIITPLYEYLPVLERGLGRGLRRQTFKFVEPSTGEVVALRPDITPQVARLVATRYGSIDGAVRLAYEGRVVRFPAQSDAPANVNLSMAAGTFAESSGPREVFQVGVELVGEGGAEADAEVISLLIAGLEAVGLMEFQIDIGQVQIAREVFDDIGLSGQDREQIIGLVARKDRSGLELVLESLGLDPASRRVLLGLTSWYGGAEILDEAEEVLVAPGALRALDALRKVVTLLGEDGHAQRLTLDLGEIRDFDYHDGILFHAYVAGVGAPLGGGGRYDHLAERYGREAPATGFAVDLEQLVAVLDRQQATIGSLPPGVLIDGPRREGLKLARELRAAGFRTTRALGAHELRSAQELGFDFVVALAGEEATIERLRDRARCRVPVGEVGAAIGEEDQWPVS